LTKSAASLAAFFMSRVGAGESMQHERDTQAISGRASEFPTTMSVLDRLERILENLPGRDERRISIPAYAQWLVTAASLYAVQDAPRAHYAGSNKARTELYDLVKRAVALREHILSMHRDALLAIRAQPDPEDPLRVAYDLRKLIVAADRAYGQLDEGGEDKSLSGGCRRNQAQAVTARAANVFTRLTGLEPTVSFDIHTRKSYGLFLEFLKAVFLALGIKASAESQARAFLKEKRPGKIGA
jgi:hypothetical protein